LFCGFKLARNGKDFLNGIFKPPRSGEGSLRGNPPQTGLGLESRARCAGFSVTEIGNRKERVRDYASFPDQSPKQVWTAVQRTPLKKEVVSEQNAKHSTIETGLR